MTRPNFKAGADPEDGPDFQGAARATLAATRGGKGGDKRRKGKAREKGKDGGVSLSFKPPGVTHLIKKAAR